jgi:predicted short-subunit dehydrogenase-like oxidoreductase (DUF2520 family)
MPARTFKRRSARPQRVAIAGLGNWGASLARALAAAGNPPAEVIRRRSQALAGALRPVPVHTWAHATLDASILWLCVPDAQIAATAARLAARLGDRSRHTLPCVFHSSGALTSQELEPLRTLGCPVASVHPLMTFPPSARRRGVSLAGVPFAVEGDARAGQAAFRLIHQLGGHPFRLSPAQKPLYHAFGAMASPMLVGLLHATALAGAAAAGSPREARQRMRPIVEQTVVNFFAHGAAASFSGPIARGDSGTVAKHLHALRRHPELLNIYRALARFAAQKLPARNRKQLASLLG